MHPPRCPYRGNASALPASMGVHNKHGFLEILEQAGPSWLAEPAWVWELTEKAWILELVDQAGPLGLAEQTEP